MLQAIEKFDNQHSLYWSLDTLSGLPGLRLVVATKVYRFCCPNWGAAVDRHASYFFNSLQITGLDGVRQPSTKFKREWSKGKHTTSRLAIYQSYSHKENLNQFIEQYLPLLHGISESLNSDGITYTCKATNMQKSWRPCDIEMAAYYWWAKNGPK